MVRLAEGTELKQFFLAGFLDGWDGTWHGFGSWSNSAQKAAWVAGQKAAIGSSGAFDKAFDAAWARFDQEAA